MTVLILPSFLGGTCKGDLIRQIFNPSYNGKATFNVGEEVNDVGKKTFIGTNNVEIDGDGIHTGFSPSIIVKVTRLLLSLTIALSITMILYNGMQYIIQTGQGKEAKDLTKNIAYIVVGIFIALFSVVIITLIQSVPTTLKDNDGLLKENNNKTDNKILEEIYQD